MPGHTNSASTPSTTPGRSANGRPWWISSRKVAAGSTLYHPAMRQVILYPDPEDGGWIAEVPSLPGCVSEGATRVEALENVQDAIAGWLSVAEETGMKVSAPALDHTFIILSRVPPTEKSIRRLAAPLAGRV